MMRHDLGRKGRHAVINQLVSVVKADILGHAVDDFVGLGESNLETIRNSGWMETLGEEILASLEESSSHDDDGGGSITGFDILSL
jgi:hypothetical protein